MPRSSPLLTPLRVHAIGICVIAMAVLAYQVLLTRIFSVMLYYHYAFVGISLAMLGLTIGAQKVYLDKQRFSPERFEKEWVKAALGFSVSSVALTLGFIYAPLLFPVSVPLPIFLLLFVIPFTYSGICVTLILTRSGAPVGKLYAADLLGASLGCIGIVEILFVLDPVTVAFGLAALIALSAWLMAGKATKLARLPKILTAMGLILFVLQGALYKTDNPHLGVYWAKGHDLGKVLFERWNAFSLVRVKPILNIPFGWGFGRPPADRGPDQLSLTIDAQAGTVITQFDGKNLQPYSYLADDVINGGYLIRPPENAAVIGVGGGRDILSALYFGAKHVTGIELNPSIFEALTQRFADFSGHLDLRPDVTLINAEARSWLNQSHAAFGLIQISLIDTWAATAAGGLTLSENRLYTVDAWKDFMNRLTPDGMLTVSRWFDPVQHKGEFYRLLSLAAETLKQRGIPASEIKRHVIALGAYGNNGTGIVTVMISASPFTPEEIATAQNTASAKGFHVMAGANTVWDDTSNVILSGKADAAFYAAQSLDLTAPTDDRPYFFHMMRLKNLFNDTVGDVAAAGGNNTAVQIVFALLAATLVCVIYFTVMPLLDTWRQIRNKGGMIPHLGYFAAIGLGFMLIEISQMQRLMIFLGHPVYGLTIVLFTLLLFGGIGSFVIGRRIEKRDIPLWLWPVILCAVLIILGSVTMPLTEYLKVYITATRILTSIILLAPAGFFMGMMFPLGMALSRPYRQLQSWFWSINGAASVLGSVLGVVISMESGISCAFWSGVACYALCAFLFYRNSKAERPAR